MICKLHAIWIFFLYISLLYCCSARDTLRDGEWISNEETLVSDGGNFELGFFTPNRSSGKTYLGIWFKWDNQTVVWVANRDNPLTDSNASFGINASDDGSLAVWDSTGKAYWSARCSYLCRNNTVKLMDSGNLVYSSEDYEYGSHGTSWESFENPTDTFLSGMKMEVNLNLTSWRDLDDPRTGNFTFMVDDQGDQIQKQYSILSGGYTYWISGEAGKFFKSDEMPSEVADFLSNFTNRSMSDCSLDPNRSCEYIGKSLYMVMGFSGEIKVWGWNKRSKIRKYGSSIPMWNIVPSEEECSVYNTCGDFGSCNRNNTLRYVNDSSSFCKCLPGFKPKVPDKWRSGYFSDGCIRKSTSCGKNDDDTFLNLKMMMMRKEPDLETKVNNEMDCEKECLQNCQCNAYSFEANMQTDNSSSGTCWIWTENLVNLQEEYPYADGGRDFSVRVPISEESTIRNCELCGTNTIPYPLRTGPNCGDPMYSSFYCNTSTGQVEFIAVNGTYRVISINPSKQIFFIKVEDAENKDDAGNSTRNLQLINQSFPFNVTRWFIDNKDDAGNSTSKVVEISWKLPREPTCNSSANCKEWPNSTCNATGDGNRRCYCNINFVWDGSNLKCTEHINLPRSGDKPSTRKVPLSLIVGITFTVIVLSCTMISIYIWRRKKAKRQERKKIDQRNRALRMLDSERHVKDLIGSSGFKEEDEKVIDVPFFDLDSILAATDYFSDANKLGQGGYGPVYKGKLPGGQKIAVKRLSSVSRQGLHEFKNEVVLIAKLQHRNLVRLQGYCIEGDEKILLYEYMLNKSLDTFIFDKSQSVILDWEMRFHIILGIGRGLLYLHQDSRVRIIHRDLKTSNILLDESMNPKISDFGLARMVGGKQTEGNTCRIVGTYGYMSPEYALDGKFSIKSDVFSFGVVLLEIVSGKKNTGFYHPEQPLSLLGYAWNLWTKNNVLDLMDETLQGTCNANQFLKCVNVGLLCVQEDPSDRPTMSNVIKMLDNESNNLPTPTRPAFVVRRDRSNTASSSSKAESNNQLTNSLQEGR